MDQSAFHSDELMAQARAGVNPGSGGIRPFMPEQHRHFFSLLPYVFVAAPDEHGWPLATVLTGSPGFVHTPSPVSMRIDALARRSDPASVGFAVGKEIGILGLDFATRRRNRANGRISEVDRSGFVVDVAQSFGNCPQYIQTRNVRLRIRPSAGEIATELDGLDDNARRLIGASDTFFVASRSRENVGGNGGIDVSHRGGKAGFVKVDGNTLFVPDFKGNWYFNTLGNFLGDPRAGLLFIDFEAGDMLQAMGTVAIDWAAGANDWPPGAQRVWRVDVARAWWRRAAVPLAWEFGDYAPTTLTTGTWS